MKVLSTHPLADTALRFDSRIRKPLIDNLDMTKSRDYLLQSYNRINHLNWIRKEPLTIRNLVLSHYNQIKITPKEKALDKYIEFLKVKKLELFSKVRCFSYEHIGITEKNIPLYKVMVTPLSYLGYHRNPEFLLHMLYVKGMLHLYDLHVAKPIFFHESWRTSEDRDLCYDIYKLSVNRLNEFLRYLLSPGLADNTRPVDSQVTVVLNRTHTGEFVPIYSNILANVYCDTVGLMLISATIANYQIFDPSLIPCDVANFLDLTNHVQEHIFGYHHSTISKIDLPIPELAQMAYDFVYKVDSSSTEIIPLTDLVSDTHTLDSSTSSTVYESEHSTASTVYESVHSTSSSTVVETTTVGENITLNDINISEINQSSINWGLVVTGIGLIVGGSICVVTGYYPDSSCFSYFFRRGGE